MSTLFSLSMSFNRLQREKKVNSVINSMVDSFTQSRSLVESALQQVHSKFISTELTNLNDSLSFDSTISFSIEAFEDAMAERGDVLAALRDKSYAEYDIQDSMNAFQLLLQHSISEKKNYYLLLSNQLEQAQAMLSGEFFTSQTILTQLEDRAEEAAIWVTTLQELVDKEKNDPTSNWQKLRTNINLIDQKKNEKVYHMFMAREENIKQIEIKQASFESISRTLLTFLALIENQKELIGILEAGLATYKQENDNDADNVEDDGVFEKEQQYVNAAVETIEKETQLSVFLESMVERELVNRDEMKKDLKYLQKTLNTRGRNNRNEVFKIQQHNINQGRNR